MRSLAIAATGMQAQQLNVEVISNNIANSATTGYKAQRVEFQDLLYQNLRRIGSTSSDAGTIVPSGVQLGAGVRPASVYRITSQGNLTVTNNKLDLAVNGNGYLMVTLPDGSTGYTRDGSLSLSPSGQVVNSSGYILNPTVTIPPKALDISVSANGQVEYSLQGNPTPVPAGQIKLSMFPNPAGLEAIGDNLYLESAASGVGTPQVPAIDGTGSIIQGSLENSNVNVVQEITTLITAQRAYEMNSKVIKTTDEMLQTVGQMQ